MKNLNLSKKGFFNSMFKTYLGSKTVTNKNESINSDNSRGINKRLNHKNSMDNILDKGRGNVFVTLKHLLNQQKNESIIRKVRSCNTVQKKK